MKARTRFTYLHLTEVPCWQKHASTENCPSCVTCHSSEAARMPTTACLGLSRRRGNRGWARDDGGLRMVENNPTEMPSNNRARTA
eukprot:8499100-Alexandrium_andersonii.AAC.1